VLKNFDFEKGLRPRVLLLTGPASLVTPSDCLAAKIPVLVTFSFLREALAFQRCGDVLKRLLVATKPSIPTVILGIMPRRIRRCAVSRS